MPLNIRKSFRYATFFFENVDLSIYKYFSETHSALNNRLGSTVNTALFLYSYFPNTSYAFIRAIVRIKICHVADKTYSCRKYVMHSRLAENGDLAMLQKKLVCYKTWIVILFCISFLIISASVTLFVLFYPKMSINAEMEKELRVNGDIITASMCNSHINQHSHGD